MRHYVVSNVHIEMRVYSDSRGREPFTQWIQSFDKTTRARIFSRLDRVESGNFGDCKAVGDNIYELRIHYGPGIRIYYGKIGSKIILLLMGGKRATQNRDIVKAKNYWQDFLRRTEG